jgi:hypothetical protein
VSDDTFAKERSQEFTCGLDGRWGQIAGLEMEQVAVNIHELNSFKVVSKRQRRLGAGTEAAAMLSPLLRLRPSAQA